MQEAPNIDDAEKLQLVMRNCVQKAVELILHARLTPLPPSLRRGSANRWFNIASEELLALREELSGWRQHISQPIRLDIFVDVGDSALLREAVGAQPRESSTVLLERWWLRYEPAAVPPERIGWPTFYKRFMVTLRGLLGFLPLMPAHRLAASLAKLRGADALRGCDALLGYRIAVAPSTLDGQLSFPEAPPPKQYTFAPPDTQHGRLSLSVAYRCPTLFSRHPLDPSPRLVDGGGSGALSAAGGGGTGLGAHVIHDYVGGGPQAPAPAQAPPHPTRALLAAAGGGEARTACTSAQRAQLTEGLLQLVPSAAAQSSAIPQRPSPRPPLPPASAPAANSLSPAFGPSAAPFKLGSTPPLPLAGVSASHAIAARAAYQRASPGGSPQVGCSPQGCSPQSCASSVAELTGLGVTGLGGLALAPALPRTSPPAAEFMLSGGVAGAAAAARRSFRNTEDLELPFMMEEELRADGGGGEPEAEEAVLGSFMLEVQQAPTLQLFGSGNRSEGGSGAASPLARSIDDFSSQLDHHLRAFNVQPQHSRARAQSAEHSLGGGVVAGSPPEPPFLALATPSPAPRPHGSAASQPGSVRSSFNTFAVGSPPLVQPVPLALPPTGPSGSYHSPYSSPPADLPLPRPSSRPTPVPGPPKVQRSDSTERLLASSPPLDQQLFPHAPNPL